MPLSNNARELIHNQFAKGGASTEIIAAIETVKDSGATSDQLNAAATQSARALITAAGSSITDATAITSGLNVVSGADGTKGVKLVATIYQTTVVNSDDTNVLNVYPADADHQIDSLGNGNPYQLPPLTSRKFDITY